MKLSHAAITSQDSPETFSMSHQSQSRSPELFLETVNGYRRTAAIKAALDLDLFTILGEGSKSAGELAAHCEASERGIRILCDYLVILGFLTKEDRTYNLTPDSGFFLDRRSQAFLGGVVELLLAPMVTQGFENFTDVVRKGGTMLPEGGAVSPENPIWVKFARVMVPMMSVPARMIAGLVDRDMGNKLKVLDLAAGHGMFGIAIAQVNPNAEIVALDWPNVLQVAKENAANAGVSERYSTIAGSAFETGYGTGYELVIIANFLHHFDPSSCETVLRKVHASLTEGGRALALEFVPNEDRVSPSMPASFSMLMLSSTPSGDAYTFSELERMFKNSGFQDVELQQVTGTTERLIIARK